MQSKILVVVLLLGLSATFAVTIEVYENPNENVTDSLPTLKSTLPNSSILNGSAAGSQSAINEPDKSVPPVTTGSVDYKSNSASSEQQQPVNNYHQHQHKHSPSYRDTPLSITPTTVSSSPPVATVVTASAVPSLSSTVSASTSSGSSFKEDSVLKDIVGANLVQHQISGYKKRQLYANAFRPAKNGTNERSYGKQPNRQSSSSKEFIPSPELTHLYGTEDHRPFHQGSPIDATYPSTVVDNDSKWFGADHINIPESFNGGEIKHNWPPKFEHHKSGKLLWLPNGQVANGGSDSTFSRTKPRSTPPKGKWKWVSEEEDGYLQQGEKPAENEKAPDLESKIISGHHYYRFPARDHPYSFDAGQTPFSSDETGSSGGINSGSTTIDPLEYLFGPTTAAVDAGFSPSKLKTAGKGDADALKNVSPWKKIIHVLSAAIPIGLIISALTPQVVYINPNMTQNPVQMQTPTPISATGGSFTNPSRQRSEDQGTGPALANPLVGFINALSMRQGDPSRWPNFSAFFRSEGSSSCEEKSFCEMARLGINHNADILFKMLWKIANETPADHARQSGLEEIFHAVKDDDCSRFQCEST